MKFIYLVNILLIVSFLTGCQENAKKDIEDNNQENTEQQQDSAAFKDTAVKVSEVELQQFATIQPGMDSIIQDSKVRMMKSLEKANLDIERFNEIRAVAEDPSKNNGVTRADLENFKTVYKELEEIKKQTDENIADRLEGAGLTKERYMEISDALEDDPDLEERVQG